jgi:hypothetical protein
LRRGRSVSDQEGLRRVLLAAGAVFLVAGLLFLARGVVTLAGDERASVGGLDVGIGVALAAMAVACVRVSRDDGLGVWCSECVARNHPDAAACGHCGAPLD